MSYIQSLRDAWQDIFKTPTAPVQTVPAEKPCENPCFHVIESWKEAKISRPRTNVTHGPNAPWDVLNEGLVVQVEECCNCGGLRGRVHETGEIILVNQDGPGRRGFNYGEHKRIKYRHLRYDG